MQGTLHILDRSGDTELAWDTEVKNGPLDPEYVEAEFNRLVRQGYLLFGTRPDGTNERIQQFDPSKYSKVTASPMFVGG